MGLPKVYNKRTYDESARAKHHWLESDSLAPVELRRDVLRRLCRWCKNKFGHFVEMHVGDDRALITVIFVASNQVIRGARGHHVHATI